MASARPFTSLVQDFFLQYLAGERGLSRNTIASYRDAMRLLLEFMGAAVRRSPDRITLEDIDARRVREFLSWLEEERGCTPRTRNQRLAAIKTFFRYVGSVAPEHLDRSRQVREIANKRIEHRPPDHLESSELQSLLAAIDTSTAPGARDLALLMLMANTGARVQEIVDLDLANLVRGDSPRVRLRGKGRKERDCPLWDRTVKAIDSWLQHRGREGGPLFLNARGNRLSRWGVAHILRTRVHAAGIERSTIRHRRITPHTIRHTTAMEMLRADVDITVISAWLGHSNLATTHFYVEIDMRMKQAALERTTAQVLPESPPSRYRTPSIIAWLDSLGREPSYVKLPISRARTATPSQPLLTGSSP